MFFLKLLEELFPISKQLTVKPVLSGNSKIRPKLVFKADYRLMQVISIAECSKDIKLQFVIKIFVLSIFIGRLRQAVIDGLFPISKYSKPCLKRPIKIDKTKNLMIHCRLMQVKSIAQCSPWSILQYEDGIKSNATG